MTSTVEVLRKDAGGREVISLRKEYRGEEHEVMFPLNQDIQVLANLIATINEDKEHDRQFVLMRRGAVGFGENETVDTQPQVKLNLLESIVAELYDDETAEAVVNATQQGEQDE